MNILGIDTTGFTSSIALVENGKKVHFNHIEPGYKINKGWGASVNALPRYHLLFLWKKFYSTIKKHKIDLKKVDAIAYSGGSGIHNCIEIGKSFSEVLSREYGFIPINIDHILAHLYSTWINRDIKKFSYPILSFSSSGSHNVLALLSNRGNCKILNTEINEDKNDEVKFYVGIGKYFYRASKLIYGENKNKNFNFLENFILLADKGDFKKYNFKQFHKKESGFDLNEFFSKIENHIKSKKNLREEERADIAASFQSAIAEIISDKLFFLAKTLGAKEIHFSGGISMNSYIEKFIKKEAKKELSELKIKYPKKDYRLDNAAMIAALAYYQNKYKIKFQNFKPIITK